jgi:hypothetical protein
VDGLVSRYPFGQAVTLLTRSRSGVDTDGNDVFTEASTVLERVPVWPGGEGSGLTGSEVEQGRDTVESGITVLLPPGTDVESIDGILVHGLRYEVAGEPARFLSPFTGRDPGILVRASRAEG